MVARFIVVLAHLALVLALCASIEYDGSLNKAKFHGLNLLKNMIYHRKPKWIVDQFH